MDSLEMRERRIEAIVEDTREVRQFISARLESHSPLPYEQINADLAAATTDLRAGGRYSRGANAAIDAAGETISGLVSILDFGHLPVRETVEALVVVAQNGMTFVDQIRNKLAQADNSRERASNRSQSGFTRIIGAEEALVSWSNTATQHVEDIAHVLARRASKISLNIATDVDLSGHHDECIPVLYSLCKDASDNGNRVDETGVTLVAQANATTKNIGNLAAGRLEVAQQFESWNAQSADTNRSMDDAENTLGLLLEFFGDKREQLSKETNSTDSATFLRVIHGLVSPLLETLNSRVVPALRAQKCHAEILPKCLDDAANVAEGVAENVASLATSNESMETGLKLCLADVALLYSQLQMHRSCIRTGK